VDKSLSQQMLRQEQAKLEKQRRRARWFMYVVNAVLLIMAALFFAILIDPNQPATFPARLTVWDYRALATRFGITCGVVSRSSTPTRRVSAATRCQLW
jgi:hypothetical protein